MADCSSRVRSALFAVLAIVMLQLVHDAIELHLFAGVLLALLRPRRHEDFELLSLGAHPGLPTPSTTHFPIRMSSSQQSSRRRYRTSTVGPEKGTGPLNAKGPVPFSGPTQTKTGSTWFQQRRIFLCPAGKIHSPRANYLADGCRKCVEDGR